MLAAKRVIIGFGENPPVSVLRLALVPVVDLVGDDGYWWVEFAVHFGGPIRHLFGHRAGGTGGFGVSCCGCGQCLLLWIRSFALC